MNQHTFFKYGLENVYFEVKIDLETSLFKSPCLIFDYHCPTDLRHKFQRSHLHYIIIICTSYLQRSIKYSEMHYVIDV